MPHLVKWHHRPGASVQIAVGVVACVLNASAGAARERTTRPPEAASERVSLADLDLSTTLGVLAAQHRLHAASIRLCRRFGDSRRVDDHATLSDCSRDAVADALRRLRVPDAAADAPARRTSTP